MIGITKPEDVVTLQRKGMTDNSIRIRISIPSGQTTRLEAWRNPWAHVVGQDDKHRCSPRIENGRYEYL